MRIETPNGSPSVAGAPAPARRRRPPLLQQAVVAFVLVLMGGLGVGLLLAAAVMAGI